MDEIWKFSVGIAHAGEKVREVEKTNRLNGSIEKQVEIQEQEEEHSLLN